MKARNVGNFFLHLGVAAALTAGVIFNHWFMVLVTFIYTWLREQAQHRWILIKHFDGTNIFRVEKQTFFGWMTGHRIWEVFQWTIGSAVICAAWEIFG